MAVYILIYILLCLLVGFLGRDRTLYFLGYFIFSLLLTPIGGLLLLVPSEVREKKSKS